MAPPITVRPAEPADAAAFAACHLDCWREAYENLWTPERFAEIDLAELTAKRERAIELGTANHALAEQDGEVVGIAISGPSRDTDPPTPVELYAIYLRAALQGSGTADDLLTAVVGEGPANLWVYRDNPRASAFYVNHGFIPDGAERPDRAGVLEIRMVRR